MASILTLSFNGISGGILSGTPMPRETEGRCLVVTQCCVCLKVREGKKWVTVENPQKVKRGASHTYCPRCMKHALREVARATA